MEFESHEKRLAVRRTWVPVTFGLSCYRKIKSVRKNESGMPQNRCLPLASSITTLESSVVHDVRSFDFVEQTTSQPTKSSKVSTIQNQTLDHASF
jgi:hypothetical protein